MAEDLFCLLKMCLSTLRVACNLTEWLNDSKTTSLDVLCKRKGFNNDRNNKQYQTKEIQVEHSAARTRTLAKAVQKGN